MNAQSNSADVAGKAAPTTVDNLMTTPEANVNRPKWYQNPVKVFAASGFGGIIIGVAIMFGIVYGILIHDDCKNTDDEESLSGIVIGAVAMLSQIYKYEDSFCDGNFTGINTTILCNITNIAFEYIDDDSNETSYMGNPINQTSPLFQTFDETDAVFSLEIGISGIRMYYEIETIKFYCRMRTQGEPYYGRVYCDLRTFDINDKDVSWIFFPHSLSEHPVFSIQNLEYRDRHVRLRPCRLDDPDVTCFRATRADSNNPGR